MLHLLKEQFSWQPRPAPERLSTSLTDLDFPRGCLTEIVGPTSSGRTTLLHAALAAATSRGEMCAVVDADDAFDSASAEAAGVRLDRLIWIRCGHHAEHALKASDLLIQGGGFGIVALDLGDTAPLTAQRISLTSWFRLRRAVENTPTVFLALSRRQNAKTCATLAIECARERVEWSGRRCGRLFRGVRIRGAAIERRKTCSPVFTAKAI